MTRTVAAIAAAQAADWAVTSALLGAGLAGEANPAARYLWTIGGPLALALLKVAGVGLAVAVLASIQRPRLRLTAAALVTIVGILGAASGAVALGTLA